MKQITAQIISHIFHPIVFFLIMPYLIVYRQTESPLYALKWQIFTSIFVFFGLALILFARFKGIFSDEDISRREERSRFFLLSWILALLYLTATLFFKGAAFSLSIVSLGIILGVVLFAALNNFLKISIHLAVVCAFVITVGLLYGYKLFLMTLWIVPLVSWSRIVLKKHTIHEIIVGSILGTIVTILTFIIAKYIYLS